MTLDIFAKELFFFSGRELKSIPFGGTLSSSKIDPVFDWNFE